MVDVAPLDPDDVGDAFPGYDDPSHRRRREQLRERLESGALDALVVTTDRSVDSVPAGWTAAMRERLGRAGASDTRVALTLALASFLDGAGHDFETTGAWTDADGADHPLYGASHFGRLVDAAVADLAVEAEAATLAGFVGYVSPDVLAHADKRVRLERGDRVLLSVPFPAADAVRCYAFAAPETPLAAALSPGPEFGFENE